VPLTRDSVVQRVNRPFNCGLLSSFFLPSTGTAIALAPSELLGVAETARARVAG
jgi:hypothetical protein